MLPPVEQPIPVFASSAPVPARPRLWLCFNLLSLDAPLVAVLWHTLFVRCFYLAPDWHITAALALAVWFIYVADRLLDTLTPSDEGFTPRHAFCRQQWSRFALALLVALVSLCWLCARLPAQVLENGAYLLCAVLVYFALVHGKTAHFRLLRSKEIAVGTIFALGASLAAWTEAATTLRLHMAIPVAILATLCSLNCIAIDCWESRFRPTAGPTEFRFLCIGPGIYFASITAIVAAVSALVLCFAAANLRPFFISSMLSALALLYLWTQSTRFTVEFLRVLADVALLTPAIACLLF